MTEQTQRKWDIIFKWFGLLSVLASAYWTVHSYRQSRASELEQQKYTQLKDAEARTKDQNSLVFQHQATLYFDTVKATAAIATAMNPKALDANAIDPKTLKDARERFAQLFWGELATVEDRRVELATISFQRCLLKKGMACDRVEVNQHDIKIDITNLEDPNLQTFSLELGACVRSALQDERGIKFSPVDSPVKVKTAITVCPYD